MNTLSHGVSSLLGACFQMGAAIPGAELRPDERALLFANFSTVTPENCMKPEPIQPTEGVFRFEKADALVELATRQGLAINGHTLVWHQQCPTWFFLEDGQPATRERTLARMRTHIVTLAGRYAGRVQSWDVVNEAISDGADYLRSSEWLKTIGEDFIAEAFRAAAAADPQAKLYYNDYNIEQAAKREKTLRLVRDLKRQGVPIHGVGIQGHWQLDRVPYRQIEEAVIAFHAEGLEVAITELDIDVVARSVAGAEIGARDERRDDPYVDGLPEDVQRRLAEQYGQLFALFLKHRDKLARVSFWGLHDGRSWLNKWPRPRTNHPLLWDRKLQPKPALDAVLAVLRPPTAEGAGITMEGGRK